MNNCITSQHHLPTHPDVPLSAHQQAEETAREYAKQDALANECRAQQAREITQSVAREVRDLIGADNYLKFRHLLWSERIKTRNLMQPPEGLALDLRLLARARKERGNAYIQKLGVAPERFAEVVQVGRKKLYDVLDWHSSYRELAKVYASAKFLDLFGDFLHDEVQAITVVQPPYGGWQSGWHFNNYGSDDFRGGHQDFIDAVAGLAGHEVTLDNDDASDVDFAQAIADAQIAFWYLPPATGIVEVTLEVQSLQSAHHLCTDDEWGWSDSNTKQTNLLMMHVMHPNVSGPSFADASFFEWDTDDSECVDRQFIPSGAHFFTRLTSSGAVPAGQWVVIRAGTRTLHQSFTNDVEIHSLSRFQYLLRSVAVRITP
jgi:hypothetical protein